MRSGSFPVDHILSYNFFAQNTSLFPGAKLCGNAKYVLIHI